MSYPSYGQPYDQSYGQYAPPPRRRRRGIKRIVFGILGILANAVGLVLMPFLGALLVAIVTAIGALGNLQDVDPAGGTISVGTTSSVVLYLPADEASSVTCTFDGVSADVVEKDDNPISMDQDGTSYVSAYQVTPPSSAEVTVTCDGATSAKYMELDVLGTLIGTGVGLVIPIVLGFLSLILLVWGIIALIRS